MDSRALSRCVVRVEARDPDTGAAILLGTGFFVAPGWLLTCAHVVGDAPEVMIRAHRDIAPEPVRGLVLARSQPPSGGAAMWPFPDLAVIQLPSAPAHPSVLLQAGDPAGEGDCHAWGFALREDGVDPPGSPATFHFEGVEGDGFLKLKAGQAARGLSGAPLLCPVRRAVVGVVAASRDVRGDLGGYAVPIAALVHGEPNMPRELAKLGARVAGRNRTAVLADRARWHAVLPVDGAEEVVGQVWAPFVRREKSSPADLLRADFGVVPYLFRDRDLHEAAQWCQEPAAVSIALVVGGGGAGKTRFAIELCKTMAERGWVAGFWRMDGAAARVPLPRLLVIDYAEAADPEALRAALDKVRRHADEIAPVRVLLLTRTRTGGGVDPLDALYENAPASLKTVLDASVDNTAAAHHLAGRQRLALYTEAITRFTAAWWPDGPPNEVQPGSVQAPDLSDDRYALPLEVLFEAHDRALRIGDPSGAGLNGTGSNGLGSSGLGVSLGGGAGATWRPPVDRVLAHEQRYWNAAAPQVPGLDASLRRRCVALATLAGAADDKQAHVLLSVLPELRGEAKAERRKRIVDWLAGMYAGPGRLNPLRPDRLGEALIISVLHAPDGSGDGLLEGVLGLPFNGQLVHVVDTLSRVTVTDERTARGAARVLAFRLRGLIALAEGQARPQLGQQASRTLAMGLNRLLTGPLHGFLADTAIIPGADNPEYQRALSVDYVRLGDLARSAGQVDHARNLYTQMLAIDERLAVADPDNPQYQGDLAVDYVRLGDLDLGAGLVDRARNLYTKAQLIHERLVAAYPDKLQYQRGLSVDCGRLGDLALGAGQVERARGLYAQAQFIHEHLVEVAPGNPQYQRDLSVDYVRLGDWARDAGEDFLAHDFYVRAQSIHERLATEDPGNPQYQGDLSLDCVRLGDLARNAQDDDLARTLFARALAIHERLAADDPDNPQYQRSLSIDYGRLGDLAFQAGQIEQARVRYVQAQAIHQRLATADPESPQYQRGLSVDCVRLGDVALRAEQFDQARELFGRALAIDGRLAAADPGNPRYQRDLSVDYGRLGDLALSTWQFDRARSNYSQAQEILQRLAWANPDNAQYQRDLEFSRARLADLGEPGSD